MKEKGMSCKDLISIIIPIYKVEKFLDRCVESVVNQTYSNLEIILVDDGSPDNCPYMCDEWAEKDSRIKVIHKLNGGLSDARNEGLKSSTGKYVGFVDSDDWIAPEMYERLLQSIIIEHSDIAACSVEMIWENNSQSSRMLVQQNNCILNRKDAQEALLDETKLKQPVWYKLYRKSIIKDIPFAKGKYHEDIFWSFQAIGNANRVSIIDYVGYYCLQRCESIMGQKYSLKRLDAVEGKCSRQDYLRINFPELEDKALVDLWFTCLYHGQAVLRELKKDEKIQALEFLNKIINKYPITKCKMIDIKKSHCIWLLLTRLSFVKTCKIRNLLKIGV